MKAASLCLSQSHPLSVSLRPSRVYTHTLPTSVFFSGSKPHLSSARLFPSSVACSQPWVREHCGPGCPSSVGQSFTHVGLGITLFATVTERTCHSLYTSSSQPRPILSPRGYCAMSRDICGGRKKVLLASSG